MSNYVNTEDELPEGEHWAILHFSSIHIPGDERSRTNPGHGYPESNEPIVRYEAFKSRDEWQKEVCRLQAQVYRSQFKAIWVRPAKIVTKVEILTTVEG